MPRNTQVTRILHVLRRLETACGATVEELAHALPADYPKHLRTVRRDLAAIENAGFPRVTERSDGQTRWKIMDGLSRIPTPGFSNTELMSLTLGRKPGVSELRAGPSGSGPRPPGAFSGGAPRGRSLPSGKRSSYPTFVL